ncbi:Pentatricopeptide repeat-containing protein [Acorus gramineus]|uniref:Pentatricopeptide repeat-containing protein n=1 Tax=Acorus gramineus TaxID=55184 RepID=A0AAV9BVF2_ACOGR|nr:Pentatricopeptide repeat-containing protein [Acorus gramineus]
MWRRRSLLTYRYLAPQFRPPVLSFTHPSTNVSSNIRRRRVIPPQFHHYNNPFFSSSSSHRNDDDEGFVSSSSAAKEDVEAVMACLLNFGANAAEARRRLESCRSVAVNHDLVREVLSRVRNDWSASYTFFLWAARGGHSHGAREYHLMISILAKMRRFDTAWALVHEMNAMVTPHTIMILVRRYCASHDVARAIDAFYSLKRFGFKPAVDDFHRLLSALCRYKNVPEAEQFLLCNAGSVFPSETKGFNIVLNGWCNVAVSPREAGRFWRHMAARDVARDAHSYASIISCYSKVGCLRDVLKVFDEMKLCGVTPNRKVYNAVIYALAKGRRTREALDLIQLMESEEGGNIDANTITFNSLIKPLCTARQADDAWTAFNQMLRRGLTPSVQTYHALFCVTRTSNEAFELFNRMKQMGCPPTTETYTMLIRTFSRRLEHENVQRLWDGMCNDGPGPDRSSYVTLIHGLFLNGRLEEASKYYQEMKAKGFTPEPRTDEMVGAWLDGKALLGKTKGQPLARMSHGHQKFGDYPKPEGLQGMEFHNTHLYESN